jgi:hypothetical protein
LYLQFEQEGDVYDEVSQDDYAKLVDKRRQEQSFVVDDGAPCLNC